LDHRKIELGDRLKDDPSDPFSLLSI
jgi:hypothetical protein